MRNAVMTLLAATLILLGASLALADVSAPDGLKDIPLVDGGKILSAASHQGAEIITVQAPGDQKKVKDFYKTALTKAGWKVEMEMENGDMALLSLVKGEWKLMVSASNTGEKEVTYSVGKSKD